MQAHMFQSPCSRFNDHPVLSPRCLSSNSIEHWCQNCHNLASAHLLKQHLGQEGCGCPGQRSSSTKLNAPSCGGCNSCLAPPYTPLQIRKGRHEHWPVCSALANTFICSANSTDSLVPGLGQVPNVQRQHQIYGAQEAPS